MHKKKGNCSNTDTIISTKLLIYCRSTNTYEEIKFKLAEPLRLENEAGELQVNDTNVKEIKAKLCDGIKLEELSIICKELVSSKHSSVGL